MQALHPEAKADFLSESRTAKVGRICEGKWAARGAEAAWCCPDANGWYWKWVAPCTVCNEKIKRPFREIDYEKGYEMLYDILGNDEDLR